MGVAEALRDVGPTDERPTLDELGGLEAVLSAVADLEPTLLPRLIEAAASWPDGPQHGALIGAVVTRLPEVEAPLDAAQSVDSLLSLVVLSRDADTARGFMRALLALVDTGLDSEPRALRASFAIRAAADLALLDVGVSSHGVLAALENLQDIRAGMASGVARAAGRLWERHDATFLRGVLKTACCHTRRQLVMHSLSSAWNAFASPSVLQRAT